MVEHDAENPILALNLSDPTWRSQLLALWHRAYRVEANLLGMDDFPPLRLSSEALAARLGRFFGIVHKERLVGAVEIEEIEEHTSVISALVVEPACFRFGIGTRLVRFVLSNASGRVQVSTSAVNAPAIALYVSLGFRRTQVFDSPEGIALCSLVRDP